MKRIIALALLIALCLTLCSCESFDLKSFVKGLIGSGDEAVSRDEGYVKTTENDEYIYEVYEDHLLLSEYIVEQKSPVINSVKLVIPKEIDGTPVTVIGSLCFYYIDYISEITVPSGVKRLDASAFYHCDGLEKLVLPESVESFGERCFAWNALLSEVNIPSKVTMIPDYCFNSCTSLDSVVLPAKVTSIGTRAFSYCSSLTEMTIPSSVTEIGERAFAECASLKFITVPASVKTIGKNIFYGSPNVFVITPEGSEMAKYCEENGIKYASSRPADDVSEEEET